MTIAAAVHKRSAYWSLTQRQLAVVGGCLSILALLLGAGGALFIHAVAEDMSDHLLAGAAQSIVDTLAVENGRLTLEVSPNALSMLTSGGRNRVFYSVTQGSQLLTGYANFPTASARGDRDGDISFRYADFLGARVRVARKVRWLPRTPAPAVVQIAESLDETRSIVRMMLIGLGLLEAVLVGFAILLLWPAMRWALRPLTILRQEIDARTASPHATVPLDPTIAPRELNGVIEAFNDLLGRIDRESTRMNRFTSDASHQMRTPLASLRTHVDLLRSCVIEKDLADSSINDIDESVRRLQRLVTQLLALASAESATETTSHPYADAVAIARQTCSRLASAAHDAGLDMRFKTEGALIVQIDPLLFEELIGNLLDNAIKYHAVGSYVLVRVKGTGNSGMVVVEDDGRGIPAEHASRVGERFFRVPRDQQYPGSGLGLSIAQVICERAGGSLSVCSGFRSSGFTVTMRFGFL